MQRVDVSLDQKGRFGESFGTAVTCLAFSQLPETKLTEI